MVKNNMYKLDTEFIMCKV